MFNNLFGKIAPGMCRLTMNGNIAVKTQAGYRSYNIKRGTLTNVTNFCFDIGEEFFFLVPTNQIFSGDIILVDGKPKCVVSQSPDTKVITAIDYETSEVRQILPERHVFMGNAFFFSKIVSMFGNLDFIKSEKGMGRMLKMTMLSSMLNGHGAPTGGAQMLPLMMMMGGDGGAFNNLFEGAFSVGEADTAAETNDEPEEE